MRPRPRIAASAIFVLRLMCSFMMIGIGKIANKKSVKMLMTLLKTPILEKVSREKHLVVGFAFRAKSQEADTGTQLKISVPAQVSEKHTRKTVSLSAEV